MSLGERLLDLRKKKGLSQEEIAGLLDVSRQTISKWETDQSTPDFDKIIPISLISGIILVSIMVFVVYYISAISYNRNLDPDNIVIPVSASVTDLISSLILISVSLFILSIFI